VKVLDLGVGWLALANPEAPLAFGGTRITPTVSRDEVVGLARAMDQKLAVHGIPVAGAKAGVVATPEEAPEALAELARRARHLLGSRVVLGKDMGATNALIDGLYRSVGLDQLAPIRAEHPSAPGRLRDLAGYRKRMTALGVLWSAQELLGSVAGLRVAVQGWGVVGAGSAWRLRHAGARVVAASDLDGWAPDPDPSGPLEVRAGPARELFGCACDVLVLAAASNSVDAAEAETVRAAAVIEGSNFGLTVGARQVLARRGIPVVPDVIASSSSAAMVGWQLATGNALRPDELWARIEAAIRRAVRERHGQ